jgi:hypothetical protein
MGMRGKHDIKSVKAVHVAHVPQGLYTAKDGTYACTISGFGKLPRISVHACVSTYVHACVSTYVHACFVYINYIQIRNMLGCKLAEYDSRTHVQCTPSDAALGPIGQANPPDA